VQHAFAKFNAIDTLGRNVFKTVNVNGNGSFDVDLNYSTALGKGKKKIGIYFNPAIGYNRNIDFVNGITNVNNSYNYEFRISVNKYIEDKLEFYLGPSVAYHQTRSSINRESNTKFRSFSGWADMTYFFKNKTQVSINGEFSMRQKDPRFSRNNNYTRINANVKKYIYKKELSVSAYVNDILNQNRGYNRSFSSYKSTESYYNTLKRYWLLTVTWEFNHQNKPATIK
jgi:Asp-tRNA(Asn)/Glu-tRNA(Gln) amidotransferase B subunit